MAGASKVTQKFKNPAQQARAIWQKPLFRDRLFIGFIFLALGLSLVIVIALLIKVRPKEFVVPLQYSTLEGFDGLGPWYRVYLFGIFSLLISFVNITLAIKNYIKSRITSFFLIIGTIVINILDLVIVLTLLTQLNL